MRDPDLERLLREAPEQREHYLVYADWLQERGDPFGELIALGAAGDEARFDQFLESHETLVLGGSKRELESRVDLVWRNGFVRSIEALDPAMTAAQWDALLSLRACELLETIILRKAWNPAIDEAIAGRAAPTFRELVVQGVPTKLFTRELRALEMFGSADFDGELLPPSLERLAVRAIRLTSTRPFGGPHLRELHVDGALLALGRSLPRLERLTISNVRSVPAVGNLIAGTDTPALCHLGIAGGYYGSDSFTHLTRAAVSTRLTSFAMTSFSLRDGVAGEIARAFPALVEIDLSDNYLTTAGLDVVRGIVPTVISGRQFAPTENPRDKIFGMFTGLSYLIGDTLAMANPRSWRHAGRDGDLYWARYREAPDREVYISTDLSRFDCTCRPKQSRACRHVIALAIVAHDHGLPERPREIAIR